MDAAFRDALVETAPHVAVKKSIPPRVDPMVEWRTLAKHVSSWGGDDQAVLKARTGA